MVGLAMYHGSVPEFLNSLNVDAKIGPQVKDHLYPFVHPKTIPEVCDSAESLD